MSPHPRPASAQARRLLLERLRASSTPRTGTRPAFTTWSGNGDRYAELSFAQRRMWFLDQWQPGNPAYVIPLAWRARGVIDPDALRTALGTVVARHGALRTSFPADGGTPVQRVHATAKPEVDVVALDAGPEGEAVLAHRLRTACRDPFDLATGPLLRATVFHLGTDESVLFLAVHHIVSDGWSSNLLIAEVAEAYTAARRGRPAQLADLRAQYADYAVWQRRSLTPEVLADHLEYWEQNLKGAPTVLELPADHPRPPVQSFEGGLHTFAVPAASAARFRALCADNDVTVFMGLLTVFAVLLRRHTGQQDMLVGTPVANRTRTEVESLVGLFVNTLVLRLDCTGDPSFSTLLDRVRRTALEGYGRQDTPFEHVVDHIKPPRDPARNPLVQVLFAMQYRETDRPELDGLPLEPHEFDSSTTTCDLVLNMRETNEGIDGMVEYNATLFTHERMGRMFEQFVTLLDAATAAPQTSVAELRLLPDAERELVLHTWNSTEVARTDATIPDLFAEQVAALPDAVAVVSGDRRMTYRELDERSSQLAHHLAARGIGADRLVGVFLHRSCELMVALLGILKAGGAYVPLDPGYPADRLAFMVTDSGADLVLTTSDLADRVPDVPVPFVHLDELRLDALPITPPGQAPGIEDLAYTIYTSGSTGRPKGVQIPHRGIVNHLLWLQETFALTAEDRLLQKTSICFDVSVWELFWPIVAGSTLVFARPDGHRDPRYLAELLHRERISVGYFVPSMLRSFLDVADLSALAGLRLLFCGGEALPVDLQNRILAETGLRLVNIYGPTETSVDVTSWTCLPGWTRPTVPIGGPVANTELYVLDPLGNPQPVGVPGELFVGGVQLARGYGGRPELTAERFVHDPFGTRPGGRLYRTGDLVRWLPDGTLEFLGRNDDQVKLRGLRIELGEIETCLASHDAVGACSVAIHEPAPGDQRLVAYVVPSPGEEIPPVQAFRSYLAMSLPDYMVPSYFVTLPELPLTANGKTDRKALPAPVLQTSADTVVAQDSLQEAISRIWGEVLGLKTVGIHDGFFDLGGHSLLLVRVQTKINELLDKDIDLVDLFRFPTIASLAAHCRDRQALTTQDIDMGGQQ